MLKKLSVILIVYLMMITGASINVSALDSNGFTYTLDNDEATITSYKCSGDIDTLRVPDQIDGHKVTKISAEFDVSYGYKINSLILPKTITNILIPNEEYYYQLNLFSGINSIQFEEANNNFYIDNDCIYSKDKSTLYFIPTGLSNLNIPNETKYVNFCSLYNTNLTSLVIPKSIEKIYRKITLSFPDSLETLDININIDMAFYSKNLKKLTFGNNVNDLSKSQIVCDNLSELSFPDSLVKMPVYIYSDNLRKINIPKNVDEVSNYFDTSSLEEIIVDPVNKYFKSVNGVLFSSDTLLKYPQNSQLENFEVPEGTKRIKRLGNSNLKSVNLPSTLEEIDSSAMYYSSNIETLNIPKNMSVLYDGEQALDILLSNCNKIKNITVDPNNKYFMIQDGAIYSKDYKTLYKYLDYNETTPLINDKTTKIGYDAFDSKENIESINAKNITEIAYGAFNNCTKLNNIILGDLEKLGSHVFRNCASIKNIDLKSTKEMDISSFEGCKNLQYIIIPDTVTDIKSYGDGSLDCILYVYPDSKAIDAINKWNSYDYNPIDYTVINSFADMVTSVKVGLLSQNTGASLKVEQLTSGSSYDKVAKYSDNFNLYDISFYKDNEKVNIDGTAIVRIPVKEGMDGNKCKVYYNDDGKFTDMNAVYKDGYMEFETTHFSEYVLVEGTLPTLAMGDVNGDGKVNVLDAVMVLRHDANIIQLDDSQLKAADVNGDGKVDVLDAVMILRYEAGIIKSFS